MKARESGMPDEETWSSFFRPDCVIEQMLADRTCRDIVEFGCGYGLFTMAAARRARGTVHALDIEPDMVSATEHAAHVAGLGNVKATIRDFVGEGSGCEEQSVDFVMLFNILHLEDPLGLLTEAHRILAPHGLVGIVHWAHDRDTPRGPPVEIRPSPDQCRVWGVQAGLVSVGDVPLPCCPHHYGLLLSRCELPGSEG